jgi:hypothetical protein
VNPPRPRPRLDQDNRAFWTGGKDGKLYITRCRDRGGYLHPPKPVCCHCHSENVAPGAVAGTGVIDTYTVNCQAWMPGLQVPLLDQCAGLLVQLACHRRDEVLASHTQQPNRPARECRNIQSMPPSRKALRARRQMGSAQANVLDNQGVPIQSRLQSTKL